MQVGELDFLFLFHTMLADLMGRDGATDDQREGGEDSDGEQRRDAAPASSFSVGPAIEFLEHGAGYVAHPV